MQDFAVQLGFKKLTLSEGKRQFDDISETHKGCVSYESRKYWLGRKGSNKMRTGK